MSGKNTVTVNPPDEGKAFLLHSGETTLLTQAESKSRLRCFYGTWAPDDPQPAIPDWYVGGEYNPGVWVRYNGEVYYCIISHMAEAGVEPDQGFHWRAIHANYVAHTSITQVNLSAENITAGSRVFIQIDMLPSVLTGGPTALNVYDSATSVLLHSFTASSFARRKLWMLLELSALEIGGTNPVWRLLAHYDPAIAADVNYSVPPEVSGVVSAAVADAMTGLFEYKGNLSAAGNPNYPPANKGDVYRISAAGRVGGGSGKVVDAGDFIVALADNFGGTEVTVGASWDDWENNIPGLTSAGLTIMQAANAAAQRTALGVYSTAETNSAATTAVNTAVPPGTILMHAGTTPAGYLECTGQEVSRATYAALFTAIGTIYGPGDSSTTFNVPDLRGRMPIGAGHASGLLPRGLGETGGAEVHTLTESEMPAHSHYYDQPYSMYYGYADGSSAGVQAISPGNQTGTTGGSNPHENMSPFSVVRFIIKF